MTRITILELFPLYHSARKWFMVTKMEIVRLEKEFTIVTTTEYSCVYKIDGSCHRKDGPASIYYNINYDLMAEFWYINGKKHRNMCIKCDFITSSSYIDAYGDYKIFKQVVENGCCIHGYENKPSCIEYNENGKIWLEEWNINGKIYDQIIY